MIVNTATGVVADTSPEFTEELVASGAWEVLKKRGGSRRGVRKSKEEKAEEEASAVEG
ncbi:hypothetical protein [Corynebacterium pyruviciproducens]|uniref:Uncharacterized protein n=1 Tax=Corynebacterium pyruviciproducens TaxID=598660 RepID=A0AAF0YTX1_9CORY|nr:hypothetical protein [Corynebacterium pyruviciproducens]WOT03377.1 hypothetical protein CYJ47_06385 [Corynebacterium pyruviciproducens]